MESEYKSYSSGEILAKTLQFTSGCIGVGVMLFLIGLPLFTLYKWVSDPELEFYLVLVSCIPLAVFGFFTLLKFRIKITADTIVFKRLLPWKVITMKKSDLYFVHYSFENKQLLVGSFDDDAETLEFNVNYVVCWVEKFRQLKAIEEENGKRITPYEKNLKRLNNGFRQYVETFAEREDASRREPQLRSLLGYVSTEDRELLEAHYGLLGHERESLEQLSDRLHVAPEELQARLDMIVNQVSLTQSWQAISESL